MKLLLLPLLLLLATADSQNYLASSSRDLTPFFRPSKAGFHPPPQTRFHTFAPSVNSENSEKVEARQDPIVQRINPFQGPAKGSIGNLPLNPRPQFNNYEFSPSDEDQSPVDNVALDGESLVPLDEIHSPPGLDEEDPEKRGVSVPDAPFDIPAEISIESPTDINFEEGKGTGIGEALGENVEVETNLEENVAETETGDSASDPSTQLNEIKTGENKDGTKEADVRVQGESKNEGQHIGINEAQNEDPSEAENEGEYEVESDGENKPLKREAVESREEPSLSFQEFNSPKPREVDSFGFNNEGEEVQSQNFNAHQPHAFSLQPFRPQQRSHPNPNQVFKAAPFNSQENRPQRQFQFRSQEQQQFPNRPHEQQQFNIRAREQQQFQGKPQEQQQFHGRPQGQHQFRGRPQEQQLAESKPQQFRPPQPFSPPRQTLSQERPKYNPLERRPLDFNSPLIKSQQQEPQESRSPLLKPQQREPQEFRNQLFNHQQQKQAHEYKQPPFVSNEPQLQGFERSPELEQNNPGRHQSQIDVAPTRVINNPRILEKGIKKRKRPFKPALEDAYHTEEENQVVNQGYDPEEEEGQEPDRLSLLLLETTFNCMKKKDGYYADEELDCEVFHFCQDKVKHSWLCPNGASFHQVHLICIPRSEDNICAKSSKFHFVNDYLYQETEGSTDSKKTYIKRYYPEGYEEGIAVLEERQAIPDFNPPPKTNEEQGTYKQREPFEAPPAYFKRNQFKQLQPQPQPQPQPQRIQTEPRIRQQQNQQQQQQTQRQQQHQQTQHQQQEERQQQHHQQLQQPSEQLEFHEEDEYDEQETQEPQQDFRPFSPFPQPTRREDLQPRPGAAFLVNEEFTVPERGTHPNRQRNHRPQ